MNPTEMLKAPVTLGTQKSQVLPPNPLKRQKLPLMSKKFSEVRKQRGVNLSLINHRRRATGFTFNKAKHVLEYYVRSKKC